MNSNKINTNVPNFLYIGTSKAGSTWVFNLLDNHPEVYIVAGKGAYYFDSHFDRGESWYLDHYQSANGQKILGEISHSYLYSKKASERIKAMNPNMKLMACFREPAERAFSAYLDRIKNLKFTGTFEQALEEIPSLLERGRYATNLAPYLEKFGRNNLHIAAFDDLKSKSESFAQDIFRFLEVDLHPMKKETLKKRMPAGTPRSKTAAAFVKKVSFAAKRLGMRRLMGKAKKSVIVRDILYRPYTEKSKPRIQPETRRYLRNEFRSEINNLDAMLGTNFTDRWGYATPKVAK